jgi:hypothetical protein
MLCPENLIVPFSGSVSIIAGGVVSGGPPEGAICVAHDASSDSSRRQRIGADDAVGFT